MAKKGKLFELSKPLYEICEPGNYWGFAMDEHVVNDLQMTPVLGDAALYVKRNKINEIIGITGMSAGDALNSVTPELKKFSEKTLTRFEAKPRMYDKFDFFGAQMDTAKDAVLCLTQRYYINNLKPLSNSATVADYRCARALYSRILHSRPDVAIFANLAAQVIEKTFRPSKTNLLNDGVKYAKREPSLGLQYAPPDKSSVHLKVYTDPSFATNDDLSSQLGIILLLYNSVGNAHIIDYRSHKSQRVVWSIMGGGAAAFMEGFGHALSNAQVV